MMKKGQVTLLVILAVVVIAVVMIIYLLSSDSLLNNLGKNRVDPVVQSVYIALSDCIEQRVIDAISLIGVKGGYVYDPENNFEETDFGNVVYGLKNGENVLPTVDDLEERIAEYIDDTSVLCIDQDDFVSYEIMQEDFKTSVKIKENKVGVSVLAETSVKKGEDTFLFDEPFEFEVPVRLGKIVKQANKIIEKQKHLDGVPLTFLSGLDIKTVFDYYSQDVLLYAVHDDESVIDTVSYSFLFLAEIEGEVTDEL